MSANAFAGVADKALGQTDDSDSTRFFNNIDTKTM